jgi:hypothetical protein
MRPYLHDAICKITHTHKLQSSLIHHNKVTMRPYLHDEICKFTHTHRSCLQVVDLAARDHWTSSIPVDGSEKWFLACNKTTKLPSLICTFGLQEHSASGWRKHRKNNDHWTKDEGLFILKTMIIGHKMKLLILMLGGSRLPSPDTATSKGYVTRILLAAVSEGWATQSPLITKILVATERSRRRKKREKQKLEPYKIYSLRHS